MHPVLPTGRNEPDTEIMTNGVCKSVKGTGEAEKHISSWDLLGMHRTVRSKDSKNGT